MISVLGVVFALLAHSQAILLDGVYALVSVVMTVLAAQVARLVEAPSSQRFHFGYAHFEPLLNLVRGLLIFAICAYALVATIEVLLRGGRTIDAGVGLCYTALSAVWSVGVSLYQRRLARRLGSPALAVDARTWLVDSVLYVGETGGFLVYLLLEPTPLAPLLKYADPVFVLIVVGFLMKVPVTTIREAVREVLHRAPPPEVQHEVRQRLAAALAGLPVHKTHARMVAVGRFFFVLVHVVVGEDFGARPDPGARRDSPAGGAIPPGGPPPGGARRGIHDGRVLGDGRQSGRRLRQERRHHRSLTLSKRRTHPGAPAAV
jgi:predicted Co/Zn/Cd cation transporter (cation efflux family)